MARGFAEGEGVEVSATVYRREHRAKLPLCTGFDTPREIGNRACLSNRVSLLISRGYSAQVAGGDELPNLSMGRG